jgi:uncharacterized protein YecT (DUF1311 family)
MMLVRSLGLALFVATISAAAADPLLSKAEIAKAAREIDACLTQADDAKTCIGSVQKPCDDAITAGGEAAHATCADNETAAWDVLLNEVWRALPGQIGPEHFAALKGVQGRWVGYRDAKCGFLGRAPAAWGLMLKSLCKLDETARRTLELREILSDPNFAAE